MGERNFRYVKQWEENGLVGGWCHRCFTHSAFDDKKALTTLTIKSKILMGDSEIQLPVIPYSQFEVY